MIRVDDALKIVLEAVSPLLAEELRLLESLNRVLAIDISADIDIPLLDNSAMDGYAVKACDSAGACQSAPKILKVIETIRAGHLPSRRVEENQAARIMTGAAIPEGADSVVMVEYTSSDPTNGNEEEERIEVYKEVKPGENIRKKGKDIQKGDLVICRGTLINSAHIGILANLGKGRIKVTRKPTVAVLATGDEIVAIEGELAPGKTRSSNIYTLCSQILRSGGIPKNLGIARDKPEEVEEKIRQGLDCDLIITSGGVSVGDYDIVKSILAKIGTDIRFWRVAMRPGKPVVFGMINGIPIFGLPGNPTSNMLSFEIFARPAILRMLGQGTDPQKEVYATLEEDLKKRKGIRYFLRARTRWQDGGYFTRRTGPQGSAILTSMALANSLIILPEEEQFIQKGSKVRVRFLD